MKKQVRNVLSLLLAAILLEATLPAVAATPGSTELYRWAASAEETDKKELASNLVSSADAKVRWNENATVYTQEGKKQIVLHNFLNESVGRGAQAYGLPQGESLRVETFPVVNAADYKAVGLSFTYAYKPATKGVNPVDSGLLRVYVSKDGMTWSEGYVGMRSAKMLGSGTTAKGEEIIFYQIHSEDLAKLAGGTIWGLRIMPDGVNGAGRGGFAIGELTVTGYKSKADFEAAVPASAGAAQGTGKMDPDLCRKVVMEAAKNSTASSELGIVVDAFSMITTVSATKVEDLLHSTQFRPMDGIKTEAADSVKALFGYMYERHEMTPEREEKILTEYEAINTTDDIVRDLNTPQSILRAYGKAQPGEILLQVTDEGNHAYMVVKSEPVYLVDQLTVDPTVSKITYLTTRGEKTETFYDVYRNQGFLPLTMEALASGTIALPEVNVQLLTADDVRLNVVSNQLMRACQIKLGTTVITKENLNDKAIICTDKELADAVTALADGKHQMTVTVTDAFGGEHVKVVEIEVKDGKASAQGSAAPSHTDVCPAKAMTDVDKNAWYHEAVDYALTNSLMGGYNATTFGPNDTLSRAMVVQVLYNKEGQPAISGKHNFTDVPADQWFNNAITWGTQKGVMGGYGNGKFGPNDSVTIEQIAVILWNYAGNPAFSGKADGVGTYSGWAANALSWAVENNILAGVPFKNATENATRAQTAQMLMNYLKNN